MRALRLHGPRDLRLEDIPEPALRPGAVKVKVEWCGICGSDLHLFRDAPIPAAYLHPITNEPGPHTMGHEFAGRVVDAADDVAGLPLGTAVTVEPTLFDATCPACRRGEPNLCDVGGFVGINGWGGGMSDYVVLPADRLHPIPEGISTQTGSLVEPLAVAWHAVRRSALRPGDSVLVVGAGPIGLGVLIAAKAQGAGLVVVSEPGAARRKAALAFGADLALHPCEHDVVARVRELTAGRGADAAFEASGAGKPAAQALIASLRKGGRAVTVAAGRPYEFDPNTLMVTEITHTGSLAYDADDFPSVLTALSTGRIQPDGLVSDRIPLERAVHDGFEELLAHPDHHVKILIGL
ncbi:2,3-butanediol dehydrogenase [Streptomyces sp. NPDC002896]|uniref:2,3-butanediol dehydrogenase n=1 Tax=Streptomyces sp. NPDC002896 TaxID=3154438 RepID=UPI00331B4BC3